MSYWPMVIYCGWWSTWSFIMYFIGSYGVLRSTLQAELYRIRKTFDKAEPLYLEAINILEESYGPDDIRYMMLYLYIYLYVGYKKKINSLDNCRWIMYVNLLKSVMDLWCMFFPSLPSETYIVNINLSLSQSHAFVKFELKNMFLYIDYVTLA